MAQKKFNSVEGFSVGIPGNVIDVVDSVANVYANRLFVQQYANLGDVGNVYIGGGFNNQVLKTDGSGGLYWALDTAPAGGNTTEVQFNTGGSLDGSSGLTFNKISNALTITGNITTGNASLGNLVTANYFSGNGSLLTSLTGGNVTGQVGNALLAGTVYSNSQPNITSVGALASLQISDTGNVYGANVVSANFITGTLTTSSQPNITTVGILTTLNVSGNVTSGNASLGNTVTANYFVGNGSLLTGSIGNANYAAYAGNIINPNQSNITSVGELSSLTVTGLITATTTGIKVANIQDSSGTLTIQTQYNTNPGDVGITANLTVGASGTGNLTVNGISDLGPVGNVKILGGSSNYVLLTDGSGGLSWSSQVPNSLVAGTVYGNVQSNITSVGTLASLSVTGLTTATGGIKVSNIQDTAGTNTISVASSTVGIIGNLTVGTGGTGNVTATYFIGNGSTLTDITAANVTGQIANALVAGTVYSNAQPNITSVGTLVSLSVSGNITSGNAILGNLVTANYFSGDGSALTNIPAGSRIANGTSNVAISSANSNITFGVDGTSNVVVVGNTLVTVTGNLSVSGSVSRDNKNVTTYVSSTSTPTNPTVGDQWYNQTNDITYQYIYDGATNYWVDISSGYISSNANAVANTLVLRDSNANIYGNYIVGAGLTITGSANLGAVGNVTITGGTANYVLQTNGSGGLSWVSPGSFSTSAAGANTQIQFNDGGSFGADANFTYNKGTDTLGVKFIAVESTGNITGGNLVSANFVTGTLTTAVQPNITSVGNLINANVDGNLLVTGNLTVNGTTEYTNVTNLYVKDPIIEMGGGTNNAPLTTNDGKDRGTLLHYYTTTPVDAFMGWDNGNGEFAFGSNVSVSSEVVTFNNFGNIRAGYYIGNGSLLTSITGGNVTGQVANALVAGTVYTAAQPNITSVGTLTSANISGNVSSGGNIIGNGQYLTSINGSNVAGQVSNALVAGTVYSNAQPNITSVGILTSLSVTGNLSTGNINGGNAVVANYFVGNGSLLTGLPAGYSNANVAAYLPTYTGNVSAAYFIGDGSALTNINGSNVTGQVANALIAGTVYSNAQPNITSVGALSNLIVSGNANVDGTLFANSIVGPSTANVTITAGVFVSTFDEFGNITLSDNVDVVNNLSAANVLTDHLLYANGVAWDLGGTYANSNVANYLPTYTGNFTAGNISTTGNITAAYIIGNGSQLTGLPAGYANSNVEAFLPTYTGIVGGTLSTNAQPNITSVGTLSELTVNGLTDLGGVGNLTITGGAAGYVLTTDGTGSLTWSAAGSGGGTSGFTSIVKDRFTTSGSSNTYTLSTTPGAKNDIEVIIDGLQQISNTYSLTGAVLSFPTNPTAGQIIEVTTFGTVDLSGNVGEVQFNNGGEFGSSDAFTFNTGTNTLSVANLITSGNITTQSGYLYVDNGIIAVSSGNAGVFNTSISNINLGLVANVTMGSTSGNVIARGTFNSNNAVINTVGVRNYYSTNDAITVTTDTIIDQFPVNSYRSAKYTMRVNSDDGYQAVEVLLVHDGASSYVTIYGSISSTGSDIVSLSSNIGLGNVRLFASTASTNTNVKILGTYVPD